MKNMHNVNLEQTFVHNLKNEHIVATEMKKPWITFLRFRYIKTKVTESYTVNG